jgi:hypothetical protein
LVSRALIPEPKKQKALHQQGFLDAPERTRTSTAYKGHKALNFVGRVKESSVPSICRDLSTGADDLDAYGDAFGITLVSRGVVNGGALSSLVGQGVGH